MDSKKIKSSKFKKIIPSILGISTIVASSSIVFGITIGLSGKVNYLEIKPYDDSNQNYISYSESTPFKSKWNISNVSEPTIEDKKTSIIKECEVANPNSFISDVSSTYAYAEEVIDGSAHLVRDKSFNENAYLGLVNWVHQKEQKVNWEPGKGFQISMDDIDNENMGAQEGVLSANVQKPTSDDINGFVSTYSAAIIDKKKSLVLPGYMHLSPLVDFAQKNSELYKQAGYVLIDSNIEDKNIASVSFRCDQGAFLTGIAACQYLQDNYDNVYSKVNSGQLSIGMFGGLPIPSVTVYMGGFEWGVWAYNHYVLNKLKEQNHWSDELTAKRTVKIIKSGVSSSYFSGTFVIGDARPIVQQLLADGADMLLPVAGPQTIDAVTEIVNQHSPAGVIGVDTDIENSDLGAKVSTSSLNKGEKVVKFSAQKDMAYVTSMILQASVFGYRGYYTDENDNTTKPILYDGQELGDRANSAIGTYGYLTVGNIDNDCIKLSKAGWGFLNSAISTISGTEITTYPASLYYLKTTKLYDHGNTGAANETLFELLQNNMKFYF